LRAAVVLQYGHFTCSKYCAEATRTDNFVQPAAQSVVRLPVSTVRARKSVLREGKILRKWIYKT
jgi:hypothetical protein